MTRCIARTAKNKKCPFMGIYEDKKCSKHTSHKQRCEHIIEEKDGETRTCKNKAEQDGKCRFHSENHITIQRNFNALTFNFEEEYDKLATIISEALDEVHNMDTPNIYAVVSSYLIKKESFVRYNTFITETFKKYCDMIDKVYENPPINDQNIYYATPIRITTYFGYLSYGDLFSIKLGNLFVHYITNINQIIGSFRQYYLHSYTEDIVSFLIHLQQSLLSFKDLFNTEKINEVLIKLIEELSKLFIPQNIHLRYPTIDNVEMVELRKSLEKVLTLKKEST